MADLSQLSDADLLALAQKQQAQTSLSALSDEELLKLAGGLKGAPMQDNGATWGGLDNFASGLLQGMGDEVKALAAATKHKLTGGALDFGNAYDQAKTMYQGARAKYGKENPVTSTVTDIAGQAAPWLAATPLMPVMGGASMAARVGGGALTGAGIGGVSGSLNAEGDLGDRAEGGLTGAAIGGLVGGAAPPVIDMVSALGRGAYNQIAGRMPFGQETVAHRKIAEALAREGLTPDQAAARMQQIGPNAALMDVGANPRSLARAAATVPGDGKAMIGEFLTQRQEGVRGANGVLQGGQIDRITRQINGIVPEDFYATREGLAARNAASDLYREAYRSNPDVASRGIDRILETPAGRDALAYARERMQNRMSLMATPDAELTEQMRLLAELGKMDRVPGGVSKGLKLETLDLVKQGLDDAYRATERKVATGNARQGELRDLASLKSALVRELDAADITARAGPNSTRPEGGAYAQARRLASDKFRNQDALETGANFMSRSEFTNPQELAQRVATMAPEELHSFRIGAAQALKQKIEDMVARADATKRLMDIPALEQKIRLAFGDDALFQRYIQGLEGEKAMFDSYAKITGGSRTGEVLAEQADAKIDPSRIMQGLQRMVSANPLDWVGGGMQALGGVKDRALMPEATSRQLARALTGQDVGPLRQAHQAVQLSEARRQAMARALTAAGAPGHGQ